MAAGSLTATAPAGVAADRDGLAPYHEPTSHGTAAGRSHHVGAKATEAPRKGRHQRSGIVRSPQERHDKKPRKMDLPKPRKAPAPPKVVTPTDRPDPRAAEMARTDEARVDSVLKATRGQSNELNGRTDRSIKISSGHYDPQRSVEVVEKRTRTRRTFANPDGTFTLQTSNTPLHYKDDHGKWQPLDPSLHASAGRLVATQCDGGVSLAGSADEQSRTTPPAWSPRPRAATGP